MNRKIAVYGVLVCLVVGCVAANSFVKKKKSVPSASTLKETIGQELAQTLVCNARMIKAEAQLQELLLDRSFDLLEQKSGSFLTEASAVQLDNFLSSLERLHDSLQKKLDELEHAIAMVHKNFNAPAKTVTKTDAEQKKI